MKTRVYQPPEGNPNCNSGTISIPALHKALKLGETFVLTDEQDALLGDDERFPYVDATKPQSPPSATPEPPKPASPTPSAP